MDKQQLTAGNATSWAVGATLGVLLGVTLLIATPRMMFPPSPTGEQTPTAVAATEDASGATEGATTTSEAENPDNDQTTTAPVGSANGEAINNTNGEAAGNASGEAAGETAGATGTGASNAEEAPAEETTAVAASTGNAEAGQAAYASCAGCHGAEGQGVVGPSLKNAAGWSDAEFTTALREGKTPERELNATMPRFAEAQLSSQQIADIHAYIKTLY